MTYGELRERVAERAGVVGLAPRSLVAIESTNSIEFVTTYLAVLHAGHVPLLGGAHTDVLATAWRADATIHAGDGDAAIERHGVGSRDLHPDLALLLSTSGSTGAPKLVRLSHANLISNASAIADYLGLGTQDRGITTLPLHYCYGLSVLHSHLVAGGGIVLTTASVVDPCFAAAMRDGVTNLAGVPHTFDLLDRVGPETINVPTLRFVTQAGGRLAPDRVRDWAERTRRWGVDFYVMYGQTEATARMAYLPPALASTHPQAIGRAIPGGHLSLRGVVGQPQDVGELVYRGPNVMLGYATTDGDLAKGSTLDELATGDLARYDTDADVFEIVGRTSRFVKPYGLRIDLDAVEASLSAGGVEAVVTGDDTGLVIGATGACEDTVRRQVAAVTGLPAGAVQVDTSDVPRTASGKVDYDALRRRRVAAAATTKDAVGTSVADVYATVLGREDVGPTDTFVSLGGDSLNYIECSVRLEKAIGGPPAEWHLRPVAELEAIERRRGWPRLDTTALLRTVGILAIVSTHMFLLYFPGGAHLMLAVVGYNFSRFQLSIDDPRERAQAVLRSLGRVAVPAVAFVALCMLVVGGYGPTTLGLVNNYLGPPTHDDGRWHYWFIEAVVQVLVIVTAVLAVPLVHRFERRRPYLVPLLFVGLGLVLRECWVVIGGYNNLRFQTHGVAWFLLLGWLIHRSTTIPLKLATTAVCLVTIPGFFGRTERELLITLGLVLLVWCRDVPLPRLAVRAVALVASASMAIFITHFRVFPPLDRNLPSGLAYLATIAAGVGIWVAGHWTIRRAAAWRRRPAPSTPTATTTLAVAVD